MMRRATLTVGLHVLVATGSLLLTGTAQATPIQPTYSANAFGFGCPFTQDNSPTLSKTFTGVTPSGDVSVAKKCDYNNGSQIVPDGASYTATAFASADKIGAKATATANVFSTSNASDNTIVLAALEPGSLNGQGVDKLGHHYASTNGWSVYSSWLLDVNVNVGSDRQEQVPTLASIGFTSSSIYYPNADLTAGTLGPGISNAYVIGDCSYSGRFGATGGVSPTPFETFGGVCGANGGHLIITLAIVIPGLQVQNILNPIGALFNPVDVVLGLADSIQVDASGGYGIGQPGETATIDAFDPFQITSMEVVDSNGVVIPYFDFTTIDGFTIPSTQPPVVGAAEPATLALFSMGLGLLLAVRRMRTNHRLA